MRQRLGEEAKPKVPEAPAAGRPTVEQAGAEALDPSYGKAELVEPAPGRIGDDPFDTFERAVMARNLTADPEPPWYAKLGTDVATGAKNAAGRVINALKTDNNKAIIAAFTVTVAAAYGVVWLASHLSTEDKPAPTAGVADAGTDAGNQDAGKEAAANAGMDAGNQDAGKEAAANAGMDAGNQDAGKEAAADTAVTPPVAKPDLTIPCKILPDESLLCATVAAAREDLQETIAWLEGSQQPTDDPNHFVGFVELSAQDGRVLRSMRTVDVNVKTGAERDLGPIDFSKKQ